MIVGLTLSVLWFDDDVMSVCIQANNGLFSGTAEVYTELDLFTRLAARVAGFPGSRADSRTIELGTFDPTLAGGGVKLGFRCANGLGLGCLGIQIRNCPERGAGIAEFGFAVEANAIDAFVQELAATQLAVGASAKLHGREVFTLQQSEISVLLASISETSSSN